MATGIKTYEEEQEDAQNKTGAVLPPVPPPSAPVATTPLTSAPKAPRVDSAGVATGTQPVLTGMPSVPPPSNTSPSPLAPPKAPTLPSVPPPDMQTFNGPRPVSQAADSTVGGPMPVSQMAQPMGGTMPVSQMAPAGKKTFDVEARKKAARDAVGWDAPGDVNAATADDYYASLPSHKRGGREAAQMVAMGFDYDEVLKLFDQTHAPVGQTQALMGAMGPRPGTQVTPEQQAAQDAQWGKNLAPGPQPEFQSLPEGWARTENGMLVKSTPGAEATYAPDSAEAMEAVAFEQTSGKPTPLPSVPAPTFTEDLGGSGLVTHNAADMGGLPPVPAPNEPFTENLGGAGMATHTAAEMGGAPRDGGGYIRDFGGTGLITHTAGDMDGTQPPPAAPRPAAVPGEVTPEMYEQQFNELNGAGSYQNGQSSNATPALPPVPAPTQAPGAAPSGQLPAVPAPDTFGRSADALRERLDIERGDSKRSLRESMAARGTSGSSVEDWTQGGGVDIERRFNSDYASGLDNILNREREYALQDKAISAQERQFLQGLDEQRAGRLQQNSQFNSGLTAQQQQFSQGLSEQIASRLQQGSQFATSLKSAESQFAISSGLNERALELQRTGMTMDDAFRKSSLEVQTRLQEQAQELQSRGIDSDNAYRYAALSQDKNYQQQVLALQANGQSFEQAHATAAQAFSQDYSNRSLAQTGKQNADSLAQQKQQAAQDQMLRLMELYLMAKGNESGYATGEADAILGAAPQGKDWGEQPGFPNNPGQGDTATVVGTAGPNTFKYVNGRWVKQ